MATHTGAGKRVSRFKETRVNAGDAYPEAAQDHSGSAGLPHSGPSAIQHTLRGVISHIPHAPWKAATLATGISAILITSTILGSRGAADFLPDMVALPAGGQNLPLIMQRALSLEGMERVDPIANPIYLKHSTIDHLQEVLASLDIIPRYEMRENSFEVHTWLELHVILPADRAINPAEYVQISRAMQGAQNAVYRRDMQGLGDIELYTEGHARQPGHYQRHPYGLMVTCESGGRMIVNPLWRFDGIAQDSEFLVLPFTVPVSGEFVNADVIDAIIQQLDSKFYVVASLDKSFSTVFAGRGENARIQAAWVSIGPKSLFTDNVMNGISGLWDLFPIPSLDLLRTSQEYPVGKMETAGEITILNPAAFYAPRFFQSGYSWKIADGMIVGSSDSAPLEAMAQSLP